MLALLPIYLVLIATRHFENLLDGDPRFCKMSESVPWAPLRIWFWSVSHGLIFPLFIPAEGILNVQREY